MVSLVSPFLFWFYLNFSFLLGVTHLPEIHRVDLVPIFQELHQLQRSTSGDSASVVTAATELSNGNSNISSVFDISLTSLSPAEQLASSTICIVVCSGKS